MKIAELKELLSTYPDGMTVIVSNVKERFQLAGGDIMYHVPETDELYLERKNVEKDGKIYHRVLVLWVS